MPRAVFIAILVLSALGVRESPLRAQSYSDTERVTAIDLSVELRPAADPTGAAQKPPTRLSPEDFEILVDGRSRKPVAVEAIAGSGPLPNQVLIFVDPTLVDGHELADSLESITAVASRLGQQAIVDLAIADPDPRYLLRGSTDPKTLENMLASTEWRHSASDELRGLRAGFLVALSDTETGIDLQSLQMAFALEEARLVQERLDRLLAFVAAHPGVGKQRVLLLVGLQFDLQPMDFYGSWGEEESQPHAEEDPDAPNLEMMTETLAANLGGLGWITHSIAPPESESLLKPGLRIGKWRVKGPAGGRVIGLRMGREAERDPELARGYLENAQALMAQGSAIEAEEAFRLALHHFYGDRRTAEEQAQAAAGLAQALEAQGQNVKARSALRMASDLDADVTSEHPEALAALLDPTAGLEVLAGETSGRVIFEPQDLQDVLAAMQRRLRLSLQMAGEPTGELYALEVRYLRQGSFAASPSWVRFGSPPEVAAARVRLLRSDGDIESPAVLEGRLERLQGSDGIALLEFRLPFADIDEANRRDQGRECRLTTTLLAEGEPIEIAQQALTCHPVEGALEGSAELSVAPGEELVGLLIEDLATGNWGADIFEIESR